MKHILCFGDSNTYGLIPGIQGRFEWGVRWTSLLEECVRKKNYRVIEEGLCGRTTIFDDTYRKGRRGSELLPILLEAHNPVDIVVLMLGTNDCKTVYGASPSKIGEGIEELLDQIDAYNPETEILLVSPIALGDGVWEEGYDTEFDANSVEVSKELPAVYKRIAQKRGIAFMAASDYAKPSSRDREHLDAEGHRNLANAISEKLACMLAQDVVVRGNRISLCGECAS